jgi:hypothetical protein
MQNKNKFEAFVERCIKKLDLEASLEEEPNYTYYIIDEEVGISWDDEKILLVLCDNYQSRENIDFSIEHLMTLKEKEAVKSDEQFNEFYAAAKDVSLFMNTDLFEENYELERMEELYDMNLTDNMVFAHLEFTEREVKLSGKLKLNEEMAYFSEEYAVWDNTIKEDLLAYLPKESFFLTSLSINPKGYYELLAEEEDNFGGIERKFKRKLGVELEEVFDNVEGDFVFSISDFEEIEYTYESYEYGPYGYEEVEKTKKEVLPLCNFVMKIKDEVLFNNIMEHVGDGTLKKRKKYYEIEGVDRPSAYIAIANKHVLISNDKKNVNAFVKGGNSDNLQQSPLKSNILASNMYATFNLDYDSYPSAIKKELRKSQNKEDKKIFGIFDDLLEDISLKQLGDDEIELVIHLTEGEGNSLSRIVGLLEDNYDFWKTVAEKN